MKLKQRQVGIWFSEKDTRGFYVVYRAGNGHSSTTTVLREWTEVSLASAGIVGKVSDDYTMFNLNGAGVGFIFVRVTNALVESEKHTSRSRAALVFWTYLFNTLKTNAGSVLRPDSLERFE